MLTNMINKIETVIDFAPLGSLVIYQVKAVDKYQLPDPSHGFYWKDTQSPNGFGPFLSLYDCMDHYKKTVQAMKIDAIVEPCDVIWVNFKKKCRI